MISLETPLGNGPHLASRGVPPEISRVVAGALDLRRGLQEPALVASGKASPHAFARGPLGIPLPTMPGPKTLCGVGAGHDHSSPVLTWILGFFWSLPRGVSPRLEWGHAPVLSSRGVAAVSWPVAWIKGSVAFPRGFLKRVSHKAFPRGCPTGLSHVPPWCESILGWKVEAVQGKQVSLEWTETSGGLWEWWHHPGVPLAFPVESASS